MDPKLSPEERNMQEEILQYEFPFDEKAWTSMDALLDRNKQKPEAGTPPAPKDIMPGPSWKLGLLLILLITCSIGAASIYWLTLKSKPNLQADTFIVPSKPAEKMKDTSPEQVAPTASESGIMNQEIAQSNTPALTPEQAFAQDESLPLKRGASSINASKLSAQSNSGILEPAIEKPDQGLNQTNQSYNTVGSNTSKSESDPTLVPVETAKMPASNPGATNEANAEEFTQIDLALLPIPALERIEYAPASYLQLDSIIHPVKRKPVITARKERGWIMGFNANTVDNNPVRLSVLPHFGYFKSYRLKPGLVLQGDLMLKYVSGYQLRAEFIDIIPGGSSHTILNTNSLLYLELPILLKYQYSAKCSILGGLKPSGNIKLFPTGLNSHFNDSGGRYLDGQAGTRYFDLGIVIGWEWRFSRLWALDIRYNQGLLDLTHDQFYKDSSTHLNSDFQVSMRYTLSKKTRRHAPKALFPPPAGQ